MSLPSVALSQRELREQNKTFFRDGFVVSHPYVVPARNKRERDVLFNAVLLGESPRLHRNNMVYTAICRKLNENDTLREAVTGSRQRVMVDQVADAGGFGIVDMLAVPGKPALFRYHARIKGRIERAGTPINIGGLGSVISRFEYERIRKASRVA